MLEDPQAGIPPAASPAEPPSALEPAGELQVAFTSAPPGLRLAGEIDPTTRASFARALALVVQSGPGDVHADLGGVSFIDVDGLRTLVATAAALGGGGRMLVLNSIPAHLARLLELTGWDEVPGLREVTGRTRAAGRRCCGAPPARASTATRATSDELTGQASEGSRFPSGAPASTLCSAPGSSSGPSAGRRRLRAAIRLDRGAWHRALASRPRGPALPAGSERNDQCHPSICQQPRIPAGSPRRSR